MGRFGRSEGKMCFFSLFCFCFSFLGDVVFCFLSFWHLYLYWHFGLFLRKNLILGGQEGEDLNKLGGGEEYDQNICIVENGFQPREDGAHL